MFASVATRKSVGSCKPADVAGASPRCRRRSRCARGCWPGTRGGPASAARGSFFFSASRSPTLKISWTMHEPFHRIILPAGHFLRDTAPGAGPGTKRISCSARHAADDLLGVAGGDDPVGQRLDGGGAVDVGDGLERAAVARGASPGSGPASAAGQLSARLQPACRSGSSTRLSGLRILAVSAMKWTPQKTMVAVLTLRGRAGQLEAVAGEVGQLLDFAVLVVVGEDGGVLASLRGRGFRR